MKIWNQDNRPLVWTFTQGMTDRYDLYIRGVCVREGMDLDTFLALYNSYKQKGM